MMGNMMGNMMFYGMGGILMMLFWAVVIIGGGYLLFRALNSNSRNSRTDDEALRILRERYARGEVTEEEYETKMKSLGSR